MTLAKSEMSPMGRDYLPPVVSSDIDSRAQTSQHDVNQHALTDAIARVRSRIEMRRASVAERAAEGVSLKHSETPPAGNASAESDEPSDASSALASVVSTFGLSLFERDVLVMCAGFELDASFAQLISTTTTANAPTFGLALAAFPDAHWSALSPGSPLRAWRLLEVMGEGAIATARLRIDERVLHFLTGVNHLDVRLRGLAQPLLAPAVKTGINATLVDDACNFLVAHATRAAVQLVGSDSDSFAATAAAICTNIAAHGLRVRTDDIPASPNERFELARLLSREASLARAAIVIECTTAADEMRVVALVELLEAPLILRVTKPVAALANRSEWYDLPTQTAVPMWNANRRVARPTMDALAQRIEAIASWDDLVLPPPQIAILREVATHVRQRQRVYDEWGFASKSARGLGISALFAGPSGTGKTTAAEVLARELNLDLYRVDLSGIVSKYIGETEKNLNRLFTSAEGANVVLLFDEADALFGKRSDVKDSHDRYANIETSYLLQRMESFGGLAILTSNMKQAIDASFLRRIRFVAYFPFPAADAREAIWRGVFPSRTPTEKLNYARLAQLSVSGGNIRNIALGAAFIAAESGESVTMQHLARAARAEYAKLERPLSDGELKGWEA